MYQYLTINICDCLYIYLGLSGYKFEKSIFPLKDNKKKMHKWINLMLASATAWMFNAWKFFLQTYANSSGQVIPFIGMSVPSTAPMQFGMWAIWWKSVLMDRISHTLSGKSMLSMVALIA